MRTTPFHHPLATHPAGAILGFRTDGRPIHAIAGGNGEGEGDSGIGDQSDSGDGDAAVGHSEDAADQSSTGDGDGTDWKAHARKWEERAKANAKAQAELEKLRQAQMSDQEKAIEAAKAEGRTAAASEYGQRLAAAEFRAAVAAAGIDLGDAAEYIDVTRFVGEDGEVNVAAIKSAVTKFSRLAPRGPGRSGGDLGGGSGHQAPTLDSQIAQAKADGNWRLAMRLENSKLPHLAANQQQ
ncbi:hypothetical protein [Streptomyces youssoufiensis]